MNATQKLLYFVIILLMNQDCLFAQSNLAGDWNLYLKSDQVSIQCDLELRQNNGNWNAVLINGNERIPIRSTVNQDSVELSIPHYDSKITMSVDNDDIGNQALIGHWQKRRSAEKWVRMEARAIRHREEKLDPEIARKFAGRWEIKFSKSDDPAVGVFRVDDRGQLLGTFLTTTGDYRFLAGSAIHDEMRLSCFDGAHAFTFKAKLTEANELEGDFWSSNTWHETFSGKRNQKASLPDSFRQTIVNQKFRLSDFEFPDVNGTPLNLGDKSFRGKPRLIYVFGSWCPNCHDAAAYFSSLEKKYGERGLRILGIAFELTGDFERDARQVKQYLKRHGCNYPVVIAGTADKKLASRTFPLLDRVRSYPTSIFVDRNGKVTAVHTGFSGPATGDAFDELQKRFEAEIESILK